MKDRSQNIGKVGPETRTASERVQQMIQKPTIEMHAHTGRPTRAMMRLLRDAARPQRRVQVS